MEVNETVTLPKYSKVAYCPEEKSVSSEYINYDGKYDINKRTLTFEQTVDLGKRIYDADEWPDFRSAVNYQRAFSKENIIILK